jgi:anhydro-N-acetylmuramic acid kinase
VQHQIQKLNNISKKESRKILGLMSGTSLDGLDMALCEISGHGKETQMKLLAFETYGYSELFKNEVREVFSTQMVNLEKLCMLNSWVAREHATIINAQLKKWNIENSEIDLIASHGQTIYHAPKRQHQQNGFENSTLQIGDGDHIAHHTDIITISDFRQKHVAAGGEGAPLAAYGDYILFADKKVDRILINIGGISNLTYIPADGSFEDLVSTDIGPGNGLIDGWVKEHFSPLKYDVDGKIAASGEVQKAMLDAIMKDPFFKSAFPKTTGPELFNNVWLEKIISKYGIVINKNEDVVATLTAFTATLLSSTIQEFSTSEKPFEVYISGGGVHNKVMLETIQTNLPEIKISTTEAISINPDAKEAILFALLANELVSGDGSCFGKGSKSAPNVGMGKVSFAG